MVWLLIADYDRTIKICQHIYGIFEKLVSSDNAIFIATEELINAKGKLRSFLENRYNTIPQYYITFYGIGSLEPIIDELSELLKVVLINDDIHHAIRVAKPRIAVYKKAYLSLATYGYQLNRWHLPNVKNNFFFPHSAKWVIDINPNPINKILLSGSLTSIYVDRIYVKNLNDPNVDYYPKTPKGFFGKDFYTYIGKFIAAFVETTRDYILAKTFEICASGSLLLCMNPNLIREFEQLGFVDNKNYISCTRENIKEKISFICDPVNKSKVNEIRIAGNDLIRLRHTSEMRYQTFKKILTADEQDLNEIETYTNLKYGTIYKIAT